MDPQVKIVAEDEQTLVQFDFGPKLDQAATVTVTSELLGRATIPDLPFENADGTPFKMDRDYFGNPRNEAHPTPGPFERPGTGNIKLKVSR